MESIWQWFVSRDWVLTSEIVKNIATAMAAVAGFFAIRSWRLELIGKDRYEMAKKISILVNSFVNLASFGWAKHVAFMNIAAGSPDGFLEISSIVNSDNFEFSPVRWNELSELQSIIWQSSLLGMPDCEAQLDEIVDSYAEIAYADGNLQRAINQSESYEEAKQKLYDLSKRVEEAINQMEAAKEKILELEAPYITFKKSKRFPFIRRR